MANNQAVVVGGGICGMVAALLLKQRFTDVVLIEQADTVGGLFCSVKDSSGAAYDMGSHIPNATGVAELDEILFADADTSSWHKIARLCSGNYFGGSWDLNSPFPDASKLPQDIYQQGCGELINLASLPESNLIYEYCANSLGIVFTESIVVPILRKLYGQDAPLKSLTMAAGLFGFTRILALPADVTATLKQLPAFDAKLGYQREADFQQRKAQDNLGEVTYYYPTTGEGIGYWVAQLQKRVERVGVEIVTSERVANIAHHDKKVTSLVLANSGRVLDCDFLFWSAPPFIALAAMGLTPARGQVTLRTALIFHLNFDRPLLDKQSHYLWVWDPSSAIFRLTLYPNLTGQCNHNHLSAEILCSPDEINSFTQSEIIEQLVSMGIVDPLAKCVSGETQVINNTFPVPTTEFQAVNQQNYETLSNCVDNVIVSGRFSGKCWRQAEVLIEAYESIMQATDAS
ncbi:MULTISPECIES: FAD-dependent oxidoreductase [unclassified Pseudoalteromonas]|uniref:FAD-dependent oxidoreductase n=1 Tax=unclassified Pseudoalteromonas TaxID=194690 RepID=UPI0020975FD0|nr:FAD-dependent oxidoreductase [Pseudoalteromonas sp. XMcav2-N]MCO7190051.1 FAD-dependent oxidoreductase [Pseudoalteromonas sp. XMcav2-N]